MCRSELSDGVRCDYRPLFVTSALVDNPQPVVMRRIEPDLPVVVGRLNQPENKMKITMKCLWTNIFGILSCLVLSSSSAGTSKLTADFRSDTTQSTEVPGSEEPSA